MCSSCDSTAPKVGRLAQKETSKGVVGGTNAPNPPPLLSALFIPSSLFLRPLSFLAVPNLTLVL